MIRIDTNEGRIFAEAEINGVPINPLRPPLIDHVDPIRRWECQAERVWVRQPWISETDDGCEIFFIGPTHTCPVSWGKFATKEAAAEYVIDPHPEPENEPFSKEETDF